MEMRKHYPGIAFSATAINEADALLETMLDEEDQNRKSTTLEVMTEENVEWTFDSLAEFLAAYKGWGHYSKTAGGRRLSVDGVHALPGSIVWIKAPVRNEIEQVGAVFDKHALSCKLPKAYIERKVKIFIGHGRNAPWKDLKDHLRDQHHYEVEAYEIGARAGHWIRDILQEMLRKSSFALLVMTGEDETAEGKMLARQNVVHEAGLFQGKLGFSRAIVLLEEGTEEFSNLAGLQQIRFPKGRIKETFGDVLAVLKREFG